MEEIILETFFNPNWDHVPDDIMSAVLMHRIGIKYQPSGAGGTRSPPATPHRPQHLTARLIQNGRQGLE